MTNPIAISDGVNLHIIPTEKFTTNIFCILIRRPLSREEVTGNALIPPILSRGSEKFPTVRDIRLAAETMEGSLLDAQIIKKGEQQIMQFFLEYPSALAAQGLDFLREITMRPRISIGFYAPYVESESQNLKNRIEGRINNRSEYTKLKCLEIMCEGEPFGLYGDGYASDLPNITAEKLLNSYNKAVSSSPIDFIALGKWDEKWLINEINSKFGPFNEPRDKVPKELLKPARSNRKIVNLDNSGDPSAQGNLCIGLRGEIPANGMDFIHFQLANEILGGGPNSKLFSNVREKESLCYAIFSTIYRFKSLMCILAGTAPDKLDYVCELAEKEMNALKNGQFCEDDILSAKLSLSKRWRQMQDNPSSCVDFYASQYLLEDSRTIDELLKHLEGATADAISQAASQLNIDTVVMMR